MSSNLTINNSPILNSYIKNATPAPKTIQTTEIQTKETLKDEKDSSQKKDELLGLLGFVALIAGCAYICRPEKANTAIPNIKKLETKTSEIWEDISKNKTIEEMALPDSLKKVLEKITRTIEKPELIKERGGKNISTILLYGPPGTGKTTFAKAIAKHFDNARFAAIDVTSLNSKYIGETEKNVQKAVVEICEEAQKNPDTKFFVFIDEIDSIMMVDEGSAKKHSNDVLNEFKRCFTEKLGKQENIVTIGATNLTIDVEKGTTRGGKVLDKPMLDRFEQKIFVDLPTSKQLKEALITAYKGKKLISEELTDTENKRLNILCNFLAQKEHNTSFRTLNGIINDTATSIEDDNKKVEIMDIVETIRNKKTELNIKQDFEIDCLIKVLNSVKN